MVRTRGVPEGSYRAVRKRLPVSLTLRDQLLNYALTSYIIDLAAAFAITVCSARVSTIGELVAYYGSRA
jgi:hypothetical protein